MTTVATEYETVIGLECHVELSTRSKMFCGCRNEFGAEPNTNVCPVCLGHPGTLPVPNRQAVEHTMKIALALGCQIAPRSLFHRKNYFYPDMPKNYQISQYDLPVGTGGHLEVEVGGEVFRVGITRVHLEEDTGKTMHVGATGRIAQAEFALEDYNRAGVPLVEVVSEPDIRSPEEARAYLTELRTLLEDLGVSDVRMEEGSLRCDANISVRQAGNPEYGVKAEIKNMNSIRSVERALRFEAERQRQALEAGESLIQETRHWDEDKGVTLPLRSKEYAFDYRYFPEPDLAPLEPDREWIDRLRAEVDAALRGGAAARRERLREEFDLEPEQARILGSSAEWMGVFERALRARDGVGPRGIANWIIQNTMAHASPEQALARVDVISDIMRLVEEGKVSVSRAKDLEPLALRSDRAAEEIAEERGWIQISDEAALGTVVDEVIAENPDPVEQFRGGKQGILGFLVGQVMRKTGGAANPQEAQRLLRDRLT